MPRVAKKETAEVANAASVEKQIGEVMTLLTADAKVHKEKTAPKKKEKIAVPSEPKPKAEKKPRVPSKVSETSNPNKKTFKPLSAEAKAQILEHSKQEGVSATHVRRMKSHMMLGKSFEEAHKIVSASAEAKTEASA